MLQPVNCGNWRRMHVTSPIILASWLRRGLQKKYLQRTSFSVPPATGSLAHADDEALLSWSLQECLGITSCNSFDFREL